MAKLPPASDSMCVGDDKGVGLGFLLEGRGYKWPGSFDLLEVGLRFPTMVS